MHGKALILKYSISLSVIPAEAGIYLKINNEIRRKI
jgi:hypothetical protein